MKSNRRIQVGLALIAFAAGVILGVLGSSLVLSHPRDPIVVPDRDREVGAWVPETAITDSSAVPPVERAPDVPAQNASLTTETMILAARERSHELYQRSIMDVTLQAIYAVANPNDRERPKSLACDSLAVAHVTLRNKAAERRYFRFMWEHGKGKPMKKTVFSRSRGAFFGSTDDVVVTVSCRDLETGLIAARSECENFPVALWLAPDEAVDFRLTFRTPAAAGRYEVEVMFDSPRFIEFTYNDPGSFDQPFYFVAGHDRGGPIEIECVQE